MEFELSTLQSCFNALTHWTTDLILSTRLWCYVTEIKETRDCKGLIEYWGHLLPNEIFQKSICLTGYLINWSIYSKKKKSLNIVLLVKSKRLNSLPKSSFIRNICNSFLRSYFGSNGKWLLCNKYLQKDFYPLQFRPKWGGGRLLKKNLFHLFIRRFMKFYINLWWNWLTKDM